MRLTMVIKQGNIVCNLHVDAERMTALFRREFSNLALFNNE